MKYTKYIALLLLSACASQPTTQSSSTTTPTAPSSTTQVQRAATAPTDKTKPQGIEMFRPSAEPKRNRLQLDYGVWNEMLDAMVIYMGPSERARSSRPEPEIGTRIIKGHDSPFRLEGNKIYFSNLDEEFIGALSAYRQDLESIGSQLDLTELNRNEQLAYWINLHNVTVIEQIALAYPVQRPSQLKLGPQQELFDDAKILNVQGMPLSLKDIRTKIVYPFWKDEKVIYGFFKGDLGGPTIQTTAFTRENVSRQLDRNAREYVNSLRGVYNSRSAIKVSSYYQEARPFFFQNWPGDIIAHFERFMDLDVKLEFDFSKPIEFQKYEIRVADLAGGEPQSSIYASGTLSESGIIPNEFRLSPAEQRIMRELSVKVNNLKLKGRIRGRVIIVDEDDMETEEKSQVD